MISYSEREVFTGRELGLLRRAQVLVGLARHEMGHDGELRCHELARAVGTVMELEHCDGWYGMHSHSWLWTTEPDRFDAQNHPNMFAPPNILDVYALGRLPQVQLIRSGSGLPYEYRRGDPRTDIHDDVIHDLLKAFGWTE